MECYIVDSFTDQAFKGNPAGVCLVDTDLEDEKMLAIAQELGLSETAFIKAAGSILNYTIRFFSPIMEIPLCGHATLAAAKVLFEKDSSKPEISFTTIQDIQLNIIKKDDSIQMEFPVYDTVPAEASEGLLEALGITQVLNTAYNKETNILLLEIESDQFLKNLCPDFQALLKSNDSINGVLVTAASQHKSYDFESRYFWPWSGTDEDPTTGGTHTFLAKYWSAKLGKNKMNSFQCSKRTGFMEVELINEDKMYIRSKAQIIFRGFLIV